MKNIFKINPITYLIILLILICGYFNYFFVIITIMFFHELGHLTMIKLSNQKINSIEVFPFGAIIKMNMQSNIKSLKFFFISSAGIIMQLILYIPFFILYKKSLITGLTYNIFLTYNKIIILFNILPIIPLDGSKIMSSITELIMPYKLNLKIINILSIITLIIFVILNDKTLTLIIIISFLLTETFKLIKNHNYIFNNFLLERYLYNIEHKKTKRVGNINQIYKNYYNFINNIRERDVLISKFKPFNWQ